MKEILIEVCCDHLESVRIAANCAIDRIEICSALALGGLSPNQELIKAIQDESAIPLMVLVRPRPGHFVYSKLEKKLILKEIESYLKLDIQGIVFGALNEQFEMDKEFMKTVLSICRQHDFTFHRAIDFVNDPFSTITTLKEMGCERILSSGQSQTAINAISRLQKMIKAAGRKFSIMPGSGINSDNVLQLIEALQVNEIHLSAKESISKYQKDIFDVSYYQCNEEELKKTVQIIRNL